MIRVTNDLAIQEDEIQINFIRSSGPGGQNVNKVSSAVQLRFSVIESPTLPADIQERLVNLAGNRITDEAIDDSDLLFFSGITLAVITDAARQRLFDHAKRLRTAGATVVFDTNYRPVL